MSNLGNNDDTQLEGGTDKTIIGNVGDRLKVDAVFNSTSPVGSPCLPPTIIQEDFNVANGGIARETSVSTGSWVDVYNKTGSGLFLGYLVTFEDPTNWMIRLLIDGNEIYGSSGFDTSDLDSPTVYGMDLNKDQGVHEQGWTVSGSTFAWRGPHATPVCYSSSIVVKVMRSKSPAKNFRAGLATRTF